MQIKFFLLRSTFAGSRCCGFEARNEFFDALFKWSSQRLVYVPLRAEVGLDGENEIAGRNEFLSPLPAARVNASQFLFAQRHAQHAALFADPERDTLAVDDYAGGLAVLPCIIFITTS